ncbi:tRNA 2-thiocytidine biosynthesis protein TtcA [Carboxylicivirga sediminis]|uniref:tRNA 2-thiocytidine biosynthesis protein TtcA n=1 Tax=Carboxylicivirga sediminis TaxID=2006564 RepID=A0A941IXI4_9BACT|nr:tRNA 2-thiocytidine biosynthesis TtcA family protein [Carboxylicivirga sediminis]MBR8536821.1 tRNA 2-thiocytidine biosynthesis protein TtcA [Carboxylicivirga sediminis]
MLKKHTKQEQAFIQKVRQTAGKAINQYQMIEADDKVMVAVSGGKDSLALLEILSNRRKGLPIDYELHAAHIITEDVPYQIDVDWLQSFCTELNVTLHLVTTRANLETAGKKKPCFACSRNRRKELFKLTHSLGIKTLAFGHHLDDAVETLVMNMAQHANISSIPASLNMFENKLKVIRPLTLLTNEEMKNYATLQGFQSLKRECPYEDHTIRLKARRIIDQMTSINPKARINIFNSMKKIDFEYLP